MQEHSQTNIIKQICYNPDNGRLILSDNLNNHYLCDLFGKKLTNFKPDLTGILSGRNRKKFEPFFSNTFSKSFSNNNNNNYSDYFPTNRKFEGFSKFPRPLCPPFVNTPKHEIKNKSIKKNLIDVLSKFFNSKQTNFIINKNNDNNGLNFLTDDLNEYDSIKNDSEKLLILLEKTFDEFKKNYKYKLNKLYNNPKFKALKIFEKFLKENPNKKIINGRELKSPNKTIYEKYNVLQSLVNKAGIKRKLLLKKNIFLTGNNNYNSNNEKNIYDGNDYNYLTNSNDFKVGRKIDMKFGMFSYEEEEKKKKEIEEKIKKEEEEKEINVENNIINDENNNNEQNENINENINENNIENNNNILIEENLDEKIQQNNISFISRESENEKKFEKKNNIKLKTKKFMENKFKKEENYLKGFMPPILSERIFRETQQVKLKTNGDLYEENLNILKKTNPIQFKLLDKFYENDLKLLTKKKKANLLNQTNMLKGKKIKFKINNDNNKKILINKRILTKSTAY